MDESYLKGPDEFKFNCFATSVLVQFREFSEHVERIKIEGRNDRMRTRIVFDKVHRIQIDRGLVRVMLVRVLRMRLSRVVASTVVTLARMTSEAVCGFGMLLQVTLHLVVTI